jgi:hypothetical protein
MLIVEVRCDSCQKRITNRIDPKREEECVSRPLKSIYREVLKEGSWRWFNGGQYCKECRNVLFGNGPDAEDKVVK